MSADHADAFAFAPRPLVEPSERWIRVAFGGQTIADSRRALLLLDYGPGRLPTYFFPREDVRMAALRPVAATESAAALDGAEQVQRWDVVAGEKVAPAAAWSFTAPDADHRPLGDYITFSWSAVGHWYEEDEEVFVHARDPYKRVDVLASSRHVRVEVAGTTVADSRRPHLLFETHLPLRFYLPRADVRMEQLEASATVSRCPYKGQARYWSLTVGGERFADLAWSYEEPIAENPRIAGLVCFLNERVDLSVDGELRERPLTPWS